MPPFNVTLLLFGAVLVLIGLVGKLDIKDIRFGTEQPRIRAASGTLGFLFILLALLDNAGVLKPGSGQNGIGLQNIISNSQSPPGENSKPGNPKSVFIVILSTQSLSEAKSVADQLKDRGHEVIVYKSLNDFLAVTIKTSSKPDAEAVRERLKQAGLIRDDSYLSDGEKWTERVYP